MGNRIRKIFCMVISVVIMVGGSKIFEWKAEQSTDDFLHETGMPWSVIEELTENQKKVICSVIDSETEFYSYDSQDYFVGENGEIMPMAAISESDLSLNLVAYKGPSDLKDVYIVFPSFCWKKSVSVGNDSFSFLLANGWEVFVDADNYQYHNLHIKGKIFDGSMVEEDVDDVTLLFNGQSYRMPRDTWHAFYEGTAVFYAEKKIPTASHKAIVQYVHDNSANGSTSYGLNFGVFSISVSPDNDKLSTLGKYFGFEEYEWD